MNVDELAAAPGLDTAEFHDRVMCFATFDRFHREYEAVQTSE